MQNRGGGRWRPVGLCGWPPCAICWWSRQWRHLSPSPSAFCVCLTMPFSNHITNITNSHLAVASFFMWFKTPVKLLESSWLYPVLQISVVPALSLLDIFIVNFAYTSYPMFPLF